MLTIILEIKYYLMPYKYRILLEIFKEKIVKFFNYDFIFSLTACEIL